MYMTDLEILKDLEDIVNKLKQRIIYYQTENKQLKKRIKELNEYVKQN